MFRKIWRSRIEFYPAIAIFIWYTVGVLLNSTVVKSRPGIGTLGWITLPTVLVFFIAVYKTYRGLTSEGGKS
jgi:hypothetical protein